jgi:hypothetical protein
MTTEIQATIIIAQNHRLVFEYFSNYANDNQWRKEVRATKVKSKKLCVGPSIIQVKVHPA